MFQTRTRGTLVLPGIGLRGRPHLAIASFMLCGALLLAIAVTPAAAATSSPPPVATPASTPAVATTPITAVSPVPGSGAALYAANCSGCHGPQGQGGFGPSQQADGFSSLVAAMMRQGGLAMPSFVDALSDQQIQTVADYVAQQIAAPVARTAVVSDGGQIYRLYCAGCHGATGRGGALTRGRNAPSLARYPAAEALAAMILGRGNMPAFAGNALDIRQQAAVSLYVQVLLAPPSPGGNGLGFIGPVSEGFAAGVALLVLVFIAVWLAWKQRRVRRA